MSQKIIISKDGYNALTDTNIDHLVFSSDYNTFKYSLANGSITLSVNTSAGGYYKVQDEITHGLGFKPFYKVYAFWAGYSPVGIFTLEDNHNISLKASVDENKMYFTAEGLNIGETITTGTSLDADYEFFHQDWNDRYCEVYDSSALNQCVDLVTAWAMRLGFEPYIFGGLNASNIYTDTPTSVLANWDRIAYTVTNSPPRKGDIVVWSSSLPGSGGYGHVGVATGTGSSSYFDCFVQNYPTGSKCHDVTYNSYNYVLGWLRKKGTVPTTTTVYDNISFTATFKYKIFKNKLNL